MVGLMSSTTWTHREPLPPPVWRGSAVVAPSNLTFLCLAWLCCATAFGTDFSGPLQDVQATLNGSVVSYQVFDPGRNIFVAGSANTPANYISNPSVNGGVVAWLAGTNVYYRIYDPGRSNWIGGSASA